MSKWSHIQWPISVLRTIPFRIFGFPHLNFGKTSNIHLGFHEITNIPLRFSKLHSIPPPKIFILTLTTSTHPSAHSPIYQTYTASTLMLIVDDIFSHVKNSEPFKDKLQTPPCPQGRNPFWFETQLLQDSSILLGPSRVGPMKPCVRSNVCRRIKHVCGHIIKEEGREQR